MNPIGPSTSSMPNSRSRVRNLRAMRRNPTRSKQCDWDYYKRAFVLAVMAAIVVLQLLSREDAYPLLMEMVVPDLNLRQLRVKGTIPTPTTVASDTVNDDKSSINSIKEDYRLAYEQSYGFFDDISTADWKLYQQRAREHENHANPRKPNSRWPKALPAVFYMNNYDPFFTCAHIRRLGGGGDGPKWTCDPHRLARVAKERYHKAKNDQKQHALTETGGNKQLLQSQSSCLVYSFGCAGKYQWEVGLAQALLGPDGKHRSCEIHVFDFSGNFTVAGHSETYNIHFHEWGLKSSYDNTMETVFPKLYNRKKDAALTIEQVMERLGHTGYVIDILKIDCEFCEWFGYKDWLSPKLDIRQLLLETHNLPTPAENSQSGKGGYWFPKSTSLTPSQFFDDIESAGFALYSKEPNIHPQSAGNGVEFAYIKLHPDFFSAKP